MVNIHPILFFKGSHFENRYKKGNAKKGGNTNFEKKTIHITSKKYKENFGKIIIKNKGSFGKIDVFFHHFFKIFF